MSCEGSWGGKERKPDHVLEAVQVYARQMLQCIVSALFSFTSMKYLEASLCARTSILGTSAIIVSKIHLIVGTANQAYVSFHSPCGHCLPICSLLLTAAVIVVLLFIIIIIIIIMQSSNGMVTAAAISGVTDTSAAASLVASSARAAALLKHSWYTMLTPITSFDAIQRTLLVMHHHCSSHTQTGNSKPCKPLRRDEESLNFPKKSRSWG